MADPEASEPRGRLLFRGRTLDAVEITSAVLTLYLVTVAAGSAILECLGVSAADALRWSIVLLPGLIGAVMAARFAEAVLRGALAAILWVSGSILRLRGTNK